MDQSHLPDSRLRVLHKHLEKNSSGVSVRSYAEKSVEEKGGRGWLPGSVIDRLDLPNAAYRSDRSTWLLRDREKSDASALEDEMSPAFVCAATSHVTSSLRVSSRPIIDILLAS